KAARGTHSNRRLTPYTRGPFYCFGIKPSLRICSLYLNRLCPYTKTRYVLATFRPGAGTLEDSRPPANASEARPRAPIVPGGRPPRDGRAASWRSPSPENPALACDGGQHLASIHGARTPA